MKARDVIKLDTAVDRTILLIDDDGDLLEGLSRLFHRSGWSVSTARNGHDALAAASSVGPSVVVQDLHLPGPSGLDLLRQLRRADPDASIIVLTGHGDIPVAVEAMHLGAEDFLTKPVGFEQLELVALRAHGKTEVRRSHTRFVRPEEQRIPGDVWGDSPAMRALARQVSVMGQTDSTILLQGETGTGKSWAAAAIHSLSGRSAAPFVEINCGGLNATFLDAELFGHERGAFTDAKTQKQGLFELAHRGTLFLDEIGDLAPELQPKLLRALETRRFRRLGGTHEIEVDVRLIAATHRPLEEEVRAGRFREDLYYRLSVIPLKLPPLRDRSVTDLTILVRRSMEEIRQRLGRGPTSISISALAALGGHKWPGNIRELRNVLERTLIAAGTANEIVPEHLPPEILGTVATSEEHEDALLALEEIELRHITRVLQHTSGNRAHAARVLGIGRRTLYDKLERYGIS